jgi:hypothetical protein
MEPESASTAPTARRNRSQLLLRLRRWHGACAPLVLAPLLLTVTSGMGYRLLKDWAGLSRDQVHWLMVLHEGEWLGHAAEPVYVLLNGLGLLWMLASGGLMLSQRWLLNQPSTPPAP